MTGAGGAGATDTDVFDDLRHIAGLALSRAGKKGPVREGLQRRIDRVEAWLHEANKQHSDLLDALEESVAAEPAPVQTVLTCVYCGHEYPAGTPAAGCDVATLTGHIATCERHPMRALEVEVQRLQREAAECFKATIETREEAWNRYISSKRANMPDTERDTFAFAYTAGGEGWRGRAKDAEQRLVEANTELDRLREICTEEEPEKPGELDRLNPYKRGWIENPTPAEQPANFIHGVRYYLGMLEDGDDWGHPLGHIESLCTEFQAAIDARAGKAPAAATDADLREALAYLWAFVEQASGTRFEAANAHNAIAAALFAKHPTVTDDSLADDCAIVARELKHRGCTTAADSFARIAAALARGGK